MVSSELPELVQVPDRVLVMRQGRTDGRTSSRIVTGRNHATGGTAEKSRSRSMIQRLLPFLYPCTFFLSVWRLHRRTS